MQSNRSAIGARIKVTVATGTGDRTIYKTVSTGGSFGCSPLRQEIGLGNATFIKAIEITWPTTGKIQAVKPVPMDGFYKVREGEAQATPWPLKKFKLASGATIPHHHTPQSR